MLEDLIDSYDFRGFAVECTLFYGESYSLGSVFISLSSHTYHSMCNRVSRKSVFYTVLRPHSRKYYRYACRYRHLHCMMTDVVMTDLNMPLAVKLHACTLVCVKYHLEAVLISTLSHIHVHPRLPPPPPPCVLSVYICMH